MNSKQGPESIAVRKNALELHYELRENMWEAAAGRIRDGADLSVIDKSVHFSREGEDVLIPVFGSFIEGIANVTNLVLREEMETVLSVLRAFADRGSQGFCDVDRLERAGQGAAQGQALRFIPLVALHRLPQLIEEQVAVAVEMQRLAEACHAIGLDQPLFERLTAEERLDEYCALYNPLWSADKLRASLGIWRAPLVRLHRGTVADKAREAVVERPRSRTQQL